MIDDFDAYFGGRITQLDDSFRDGTMTLEDLKDAFEVLRDDMDDALEEDDLSMDAYSSLVEEIDSVLDAIDGKRVSKIIGNAE